MQFFAGLVLNRIRIALQPLDMPLQQIVLPLQTMQLMFQALRVLPLLLIHRKPILAKDYVVPHRQREQRGNSRCHLSPAHLASLIQAHNATRLLCCRTRLVRTSHRTKYKLHNTDRQVENPLPARTYLVHTASGITPTTPSRLRNHRSPYNIPPNGPLIE